MNHINFEENNSIQNHNEKVQKIKPRFCPACYQLGISKELKLCQINLEEAVYICPNHVNCLYPQGYGWEFLKRTLDEMVTTDLSSSSDDSEDEIEKYIKNCEGSSVDGNLDNFVKNILFESQENEDKNRTGQVMNDTSYESKQIIAVENHKPNATDFMIGKLNELEMEAKDRIHDNVNVLVKELKETMKILDYQIRDKKTNDSENLNENLLPPESFKSDKKRIKVVSEQIISNTASCPEIQLLLNNQPQTQCFTMEYSGDNKMLFKEINQLTNTENIAQNNSDLTLLDELEQNLNQTAETIAHILSQDSTLNENFVSAEKLDVARTTIKQGEESISQQVWTKKIDSLPQTVTQTNQKTNFLPEVLDQSEFLNKASQVETKLPSKILAETNPDTNLLSEILNETANVQNKLQELYKQAQPQVNLIPEVMIQNINQNLDLLDGHSERTSCLEQSELNNTSRDVHNMNSFLLRNEFVQPNCKGNNNLAFEAISNNVGSDFIYDQITNKNESVHTPQNIHLDDNLVWNVKEPANKTNFSQTITNSDLTCRISATSIPKSEYVQTTGNNDPGNLTWVQFFTDAIKIIPELPDANEDNPVWNKYASKPLAANQTVDMQTAINNGLISAAQVAGKKPPLNGKLETVSFSKDSNEMSAQIQKQIRRCLRNRSPPDSKDAAVSMPSPSCISKDPKSIKRTSKPKSNLAKNVDAKNKTHVRAPTKIKSPAQKIKLSTEKSLSTPAQNQSTKVNSSPNSVKAKVNSTLLKKFKKSQVESPTEFKKVNIVKNIALQKNHTALLRNLQIIPDTNRPTGNKTASLNSPNQVKSVYHEFFSPATSVDSVQSKAKKYSSFDFQSINNVPVI